MGDENRQNSLILFSPIERSHEKLLIGPFAGITTAEASRWIGVTAGRQQGVGIEVTLGEGGFFRFDLIS